MGAVVLHDGEPDVSEAVARAILTAQVPDLADRPLTDVTAAGTDNALWRVDVDGQRSMLLRLPRRHQPAASVEREARVLGELGESALAAQIRLPKVVHVGESQPEFAHRWLLLSWLPGEDLVRAPLAAADQLGFAERLGEVVATIGRLAIDVPDRSVGLRGGPIAPLVSSIHRWLDDPQWSAADFVDVVTCKRLADEALDATDAATVGFVHGDLLPGNVLRDGHDFAVIDWGSAARADVAQDLAPAWSLFDHQARERFRRATGADDGAWLRARTFELEHAIGGIVYYEPKGHPLGDIMRRTYERIMVEARSSS